MCKVYNSIGCLTTVKLHLDKHNITEFKSLNKMISFQKNYSASRQNIISTSEIIIENERSKIISENLQLKNLIASTKAVVKKKLLEQIEHSKLRLQILSSLEPQNFWQKVINYLRIFFIKRKIRSYEQSLPSKILRAVNQLMKTYQRNENRCNYINSKFQDAVIDNCSGDLRTLERKKILIDEVNRSIYGAIGEQKVVQELEKLHDEYVLINDFCLSFSPPIYNRRENDYIKSIQVDHLLIAPSGVFVIETKNWSKQSMNSLNLRSPVSQLRRSSFALFVVLNKNTEGQVLNLHRWGKKKIALKNILVFINQKPLEEFQYVKVLALNQLLNYIKYFPPIFTEKETATIANELISLSKK